MSCCRCSHVLDVVEVARVLQSRPQMEQDVRARAVEARGLHELGHGLVELAAAVAVHGLGPVAVRLRAGVFAVRAEAKGRRGRRASSRSFSLGVVRATPPRRCSVSPAR